ncbi:hypothetical protein ACTFIN_12965 [Clostridium cagae]|uniref:Uncharacterized protein n=1 Tax=Clostridium botulinum (strain Eklund 17B / Type B) TaxID=935198 RepID=B2TIT1_CLOBB|nr:hypothetical protein [Clostridium sp. RO3]ACD22642.1 conserved hypothetical protein [Clostridium botulinum B str. Eklund 17B (NRP)]MBN1037392.1 hypothetical protein [Clostridium botulinum]MBN1044052.1 hypothetical protein [Clostridium botulinum]MBN1050742.1 hypothetical protein [Clostridium botulinum]MBN1054037.1 hypothetical protein [Clostridium botulinum]
MVVVKLEKNKKRQIIFKIKFTDGEENKLFFKRAIIEGKKIKGDFDYQVPLRFFIPIVKNINKKDILLDKDSLLYYLEFSDMYDQNYYNETQATPNYMKKWREEGCPEIYKVTLDKDNCNIEKEVIFNKPKVYFE